MKKFIIPCLIAVALVSLSACSTEPTTHSSTTTSQESTTLQSPVNTTTTETQTK